MLPKEERKQDEKATAYCLKKKETWSNGNSILPKEERNKIKRQQHTLLPEEERNKIKRQQHTAWRRKKSIWNSNSILPLIYWISHLRSVFRIQKYSGPDPEICPGSRNLPLFGSGYCLIVSGSVSGPFHPVAFEVWRKNYTGYFFIYFV